MCKVVEQSLQLTIAGHCVIDREQGKDPWEILGAMREARDSLSVRPVEWVGLSRSG